VVVGLKGAAIASQAGSENARKDRCGPVISATVRANNRRFTGKTA
jgi:hypothetical protein